MSKINCMQCGCQYETMREVEACEAPGCKWRPNPMTDGPSDDRAFLGYMREAASEGFPVFGAQLNRLRRLARESAGVDFPRQWFGTAAKTATLRATDLALVWLRYQDTAMELRRLLSIALERSQAFGDLTSDEIVWRADVKAALERKL